MSMLESLSTKSKGEGMVASKKKEEKKMTKEQEALVASIGEMRNALSQLSLPLNVHMALVQKAALIEEYLKR